MSDYEKALALIDRWERHCAGLENDLRLEKEIAKNIRAECSRLQQRLEELQRENEFLALRLFRSEGPGED